MLCIFVFVGCVVIVDCGGSGGEDGVEGEGVFSCCGGVVFGVLIWSILCCLLNEYF